MRAQRKQVIRDVRSDSKAACGIFCVDHHQVDRMGHEEVAQMCMDNPASGTTKNISDKKYLQKVTISRVRWVHRTRQKGEDNVNPNVPSKDVSARGFACFKVFGESL